MIELEGELKNARDRVIELEGELKDEIGRRREVDDVIETTSALWRAERERYNQEIWAAKQFMPEGVRLALLTINQCLRRDGQPVIEAVRELEIE